MAGSLQEMTGRKQSCLEPLTRRYFEEFHLCPGCNQVYWKGSHYERMMGLIVSLKG